MKNKTLRTVLAFLLALTLTASAAMLSFAQNSKIEHRLRWYMEENEGRIPVIIWTRTGNSAETVAMIGEITEIERVYDDIPMIGVNATADEIERLALLDQIESLDFAKTWMEMSHAERYQYVKFAFNHEEVFYHNPELDQQLANMTDVITPALINSELTDDANTDGFKYFLMRVADYMEADLDVSVLISLAANETAEKPLRRACLTQMIRQTQLRDARTEAAVKALTNDPDVPFACSAVCALATVDPAFAKKWTAEKLEGFDGTLTNDSIAFVSAREYVLSHGGASQEECEEFVTQCCLWRDAALEANAQKSPDPVAQYHHYIRDLMLHTGRLGDVNGDGRVTATDARFALRASAHLESLSTMQLASADANGDGKITAAEARKILRVSARLEQMN